MDFLGEWLYLIVGIAVIGLLSIVGLLAGRRSRSTPPAGGTDVLAPPREKPTEEQPPAPTAPPSMCS